MEALAEDEGWSIACLFSDSEQGLKTGELSVYCVDNTIDQRFSPPNRHDKNPIERYVQTIANPALASMIHGSAPPQMWCWAVSQSVYVSNRVSRKGSRSPLHQLSGSDRHGLTGVRAMFCTAWARVDNPGSEAPKAFKCVNLGNSWDTFGAYNLLNLTTKKVVVSADVVFNETEFPYATAASTTAETKQEVRDWVWDLRTDAPLAAAPAPAAAAQPDPAPRPVAQPATQPVPALGQKKKKRRKKSVSWAEPVDGSPRRSPRLNPPSAGLADPLAGTYSAPGQPPPAPGQPDPTKYGRKSPRGWQPSAGNLNSIASYMCSIGELGQFSARDGEERIEPEVDLPPYDDIWSHVVWGNEPAPKGFDQAKRRPDFPRWQAAMRKEFDSHVARGTWILVPRSEAISAGIPIIPSMWVLKDKMLADGGIQAKARLVACGSRQQEDASVETFAATAQITTLRVVLSLAAYHDLELRNGDFSVAFLNADALETVYMEQPRGFAVKNPRDWVCKLQLGLYGTRTANRGWSALLRHTLQEFGLKRSEADHGLFYMQNGGKPIFLVTHVDDLIYAGDPDVWDKLVRFIQEKFEFQDLGELEWVGARHARFTRPPQTNHQARPRTLRPQARRTVLR